MLLERSATRVEKVEGRRILGKGDAPGFDRGDWVSVLACMSGGMQGEAQGVWVFRLTECEVLLRTFVRGKYRVGCALRR